MFRNYSFMRNENKENSLRSDAVKIFNIDSSPVGGIIVARDKFLSALVKKSSNKTSRWNRSSKDENKANSRHIEKKREKEIQHEVGKDRKRYSNSSNDSLAQVRLKVKSTMYRHSCYYMLFKPYRTGDRIPEAVVTRVATLET